MEGFREPIVCPDLVTANIKSGVTAIDHQAFFDYVNLTTVTLPNSLKIIEGSAFQNCKSLTSITIPDGVTIIDNNAFEGCENLTTLVIPNSVKSIALDAFNGCSRLPSLTIPNADFIGNRAFQNCTSLSSFSVHWSTPLPITHIVFFNVNTSAITLHVPAGTEELYKAPPVWSDFKIVAL